VSQGYAVSDDEFDREQYGGVLWGLSVPIISTGGVRGALGVLLMTHIYHKGEGVSDIVDLLQQAASEIAERMD
jgi:DNA-binding IclR family transcriptional regulator